MLDLNKVIVDLQTGELAEEELFEMYDAGYLNNDEMEYIDMTLQEIAPVLLGIGALGAARAGYNAYKIWNRSRKLANTIQAAKNISNATKTARLNKVTNIGNQAQRNMNINGAGAAGFGYMANTMANQQK